MDNVFRFEEAIEYIMRFNPNEARKEVRETLKMQVNQMRRDPEITAMGTLGYHLVRDNEGGFVVWVDPALAVGEHNAKRS